MTEIERHLLAAFERLESDYLKRERALQEVLLTTQRRLDDTTVRLDAMTSSFEALLTHLSHLSAQLNAFHELLTR